MTMFVNQVKTVLLLGAMTGLVVAVGGMMGRGYVLPFFVIAVVMNLGAFLFSDRIAIATMRGRELDERTGGDLYRMLVRLSERAGLPKVPRLYVSPHQAPNAFATGRSPRRAAVCFTQGALDVLDPAEIEGVMAHELAHIKNRDTLISTIAAIMAGVLAFIAQWSFFLGGANRNVNPLVLILTVILAAVGAAMLKAMISRSREFIADAEGARIAGTGRGLISALQKLDANARRVPLESANPAQNSLFIVEPFAGDVVHRLFASHPPTEDRVRALSRLR